MARNDRQGDVKGVFGKRKSRRNEGRMAKKKKLSTCDDDSCLVKDIVPKKDKPKREKGMESKRKKKSIDDSSKSGIADSGSVHHDFYQNNDGRAFINEGTVDSDFEKGEILLQVESNGDKAYEQQGSAKPETSNSTSINVVGSLTDPPNHLPHSTPPILWASCQRDMSECSPIFPDVVLQVKQSSGGFAIGLLLRQSQFMTSIHLLNSQLILHINDTPKRKPQFLALNKSCHADITISVFAEVDSVPTLFPHPSGAKYLYVGEYRFMEWKKESKRHRIVIQRRSEPCIKRRCYYDIPNQADLSLGLFQGIACPTCLCALPALKWAGWSCHSCSCFIQAVPVRVQLHRYFAKVNLSYSGPRMDNGKAVLNESTGSKRNLSIWSDGIKSAEYLLSPDDMEMHLHHLLCSSHLEADSTRILNLLLDRDMPYRRCTRKMTFHASFRLLDAIHHPASYLYDCHSYDLATPNAVKELIKAVDQCVSRFATESIEIFNDISIVLSQGDSLDLLARVEESEGIASHRAVIHLGPAAQVIIWEKTSGKEIVSLSLSHGDVLYIPHCVKFGKPYQMKVLHNEVSMTCIARCLQSSDIASRRKSV